MLTAFAVFVLAGLRGHSHEGSCVLALPQGALRRSSTAGSSSSYAASLQGLDAYHRRLHDEDCVYECHEHAACLPEKVQALFVPQITVGICTTTSTGTVTTTSLTTTMTSTGTTRTTFTKTTVTRTLSSITSTMSATETTTTTPTSTSSSTSLTSTTATTSTSTTTATLTTFTASTSSSTSATTLVECSIIDGSVASSAYPCRCGTSSCLNGEICTASANACQVKCSCVTPNSGTGASNNQYTCTDGHSANCLATELCYATAPFVKDQLSDGCQLPTTTTNSTTMTTITGTITTLTTTTFTSITPTGTTSTTSTSSSSTSTTSSASTSTTSPTHTATTRTGSTLTSLTSTDSSMSTTRSTISLTTGSITNTATTYTTTTSSSSTSTPTITESTTTSSTTTSSTQSSSTTSTTSLLPCTACPWYPIKDCGFVQPGQMCVPTLLKGPCISWGEVAPEASSSLFMNFSCPADNNVFRVVDEIGTMPQVRCKVCGVAAASMDIDGRPGFYTGRLSFGPNQVDGMINETMIKEYKVYFVNAHKEKLRLIATVPRSASPANTACCETDYYQLPMINVPLEPPGDIAGPSRIMIVPVDTADAEMPLADAVVTLPDANSTTTAMTALEETTTRRSGRGDSSETFGLHSSQSAMLILWALAMSLATMQP